MIVKNFLEAKPISAVSHEGKGFVKNVTLFDAAEFSTNLSFMIYSELAPGTSIGYHTHGDNEEVYLILEGEGTMTVNGQSRKVVAGDVILNEPHWSHGLENNSSSVLKLFVFEVKK
ncbi:MAG: cupin domain-containing protein [Chloroflexi bacterium]|nr:MAG: cupin domain-containing protein [Chloroflexota bacterium]